MGAGKPDYLKLHEMGKLPKEMQHMVPGAAATVKVEELTKDVESLTAEVESLKLKLKVAISLMTTEQKSELKGKFDELKK